MPAALNLAIIVHFCDYNLFSYVIIKGIINNYFAVLLRIVERYISEARASREQIRRLMFTFVIKHIIDTIISAVF